MKLSTLTSGQHILFGLTTSRLINDELNRNLKESELNKLAELIIELDSPENYDTELTPSESCEEHSQHIYTIFEDFWEENHIYILDILN